MIHNDVIALNENLAELRSIIVFGEAIRRHFLHDSDLTDAATLVNAQHYLAARKVVPGTTAHKIYEHCAFITRLYAVYEGFVHELVRKWLGAISDITPSWSNLPDQIRTNHRIGIGHILQKLDRPRYAHLTAEYLSSSLHSTCSGSPNYNVVSDAFFFDIQNLRADQICNLLGRVGLVDTMAWLHGDAELSDFCQANACSIESQLKAFIEYRNDAAHGAVSVDEVLGTSELSLHLDFITLLCVSLANFAVSRYFERAKRQDKCTKLGIVTERLRKAGVVILKAEDTKICRGDHIVVSNGSRCTIGIIQSIQLNNVDYDTVLATKDLELGIKLNVASRVGSELFRI